MPKGEVIVVGNPREELQGRGKGYKPHRFDVDLQGGGVLCASAPSAVMRQQWMDAVAAATAGGSAAAPTAPEASPRAAKRT